MDPFSLFGVATLASRIVHDDKSLIRMTYKYYDLSSDGDDDNNQHSSEDDEESDLEYLGGKGSKDKQQQQQSNNVQETLVHDPLWGRTIVEYCCGDIS